MNVESLSSYFPAEVIEIFKEQGIFELNEPQIMAIEKGLFDKSMIISAPTASGKTFIAELAFLHHILFKKGKVLYVVPLRALGSEKYKEFKEKYERVGVKVALSMGDFDSDDPWLKNYDLIIVTSEKLDSLMRHNVDWIKYVSLVVLDEVHLLNDVSRGPTLEIVITRLKTSYPHIKFLGLSATIKNAEEIASWLKAETVISNYRPIPLIKCAFFNETLVFEDYSTQTIDGCVDAIDLIRYYFSKGKQVLCFVNSRSNAERLAEKISSTLLYGNEHLNNLSSSILNVLETPTEQCKKLAKCVKKGVAFHHAGLLQRQRELVEEYFRKGIIKVIVATPTLAAGVNLPASVVIIKDLTRYEYGKGQLYIPVIEYQQMVGRSGRPKYDKEGLAIAVCKRQDEVDYVVENYINGENEKIFSKLGVEPVLRIHVLALIASYEKITLSDLFSFMANTFYAYQYGSVAMLERNVERIVEKLIDYGLVEKEGVVESDDSFFVKASNIDNGKIVLKPTKLGKRISELYLDPETAYLFIDGLAKVDGVKHLEDFAIINLICQAIEMKPLPRIKKGERDTYMLWAERKADSFLIDVPPIWHYQFDEFLSSIKATAILMEWMDEKSEDELFERYGVAPGDLRIMLDTAVWMLYSLREIASILDADVLVVEQINKLMHRVKHGVKEELIPFVKLQGVGRARARKLYTSGFRSLKDLENAPLEKVAGVIGKKTAEKIKDQLNKNLY